MVTLSELEVDGWMLRTARRRGCALIYFDMAVGMQWRHWG